MGNKKDFGRPSQRSNGSGPKFCEANGIASYLSRYME
jgi:hypothetical protein